LLFVDALFFKIADSLSFARTRRDICAKLGAIGRETDERILERKNKQHNDCYNINAIRKKLACLVKSNIKNKMSSKME